MSAEQQERGDAEAAASEARRVAVDVRNGKVHCDRIATALEWAADSVRALLRRTPEAQQEHAIGGGLPLECSVCGRSVYEHPGGGRFVPCSEAQQEQRIEGWAHWHSGEAIPRLCTFEDGTNTVATGSGSRHVRATLILRTSPSTGEGE